MTYKLTYFNIKARGEPIRFLLSYGGLKFEDIRINMEEWFDLKPTITFGQLPLLELDGKVAHQSVAICRYLGKQVKLAGENDWENLEIDSAVDTLCDLRQKIKDYAFETRADIKESQRKQLFDETIPYYLKKFDEQAKKNGGYFAIGRLTWADIFLVPNIDQMNFFAEKDIFADYPNLLEVKKKVLSVPSIKEWVDKRPVTNDAKWIEARKTLVQHSPTK